jgi:hypothetical protein
MSKISSLTEKLNNAKPSNMDDEKKAAVLQKIKLTASFAAGVLLTVTAVATASYYNSFPKTDENENIEETTDEN